MARREFKGGAAQLTLASGIASTDLTITTSGTATNWPTGGVGKFLFVIDRGLASEEKVLATSRSANTITVASTGDRGADGTTATSHSSGAFVEHVVGAIDLDDPNAHINVTTQDDHTQYLNVTRHDVVARHPTGVLDMTAITAALLPPGLMAPYCGATAPTGWLLCDGSAVSRATYAGLFAVLSTTYGAGDGSTTFNLPDLRQRFPMGKAASGTGSTLGGTGGSKDQTVTTHNHSHNHTATSGNENSSLAHTHSTDSQGSHAHTGGGGINNMTVTTPSTIGLVATATNQAAFTTMDAAGSHGHTAASNGPSTHTHAVTTTTDASGAGSSGTDANLPGYQVLTYIVKT